jgi:CheY-like chemotaxis protein
LLFSVRDTGIGIPSEKLPLLFQPFSQLDSGLTRRYEGTGLGLAISRRLVEAMGGTLSVESEPGRGSTFHLRVPLELAPAGDQTPGEDAPLPTAPIRPLRILLAEDNPVNQRLAVVLLEKRGHLVTVVVNGRQAVAAVERQTFDVVLMDVQMPEMDGLEATRLIRQRESETGRRVPIVAMTASALKGDRERCLEAGMDEHIAKPIRTSELFAVLARIAGQDDRPCPDRPAEVSGPPATGNGSRDFNAEAALKHVGGDHRLLSELIRLYLTDSPGWLEELRQAVDRRDNDGVRRTAHNLKGALVHFELESAITAAQALEFRGKDANLDGADKALAAMAGELERLRPQLAAYQSD